MSRGATRALIHSDSILRSLPPRFPSLLWVKLKKTAAEAELISLAHYQRIQRGIEFAFIDEVRLKSLRFA